jgi:hypothetical protein
MSLSIVVFGVLNIAVYCAPARYEALGLLLVAAPFYTGIIGPLFSINQSIVPAHMRATAVSLLLFSANLLGMGLGGLSTGFISDALRHTYGNDSLRYALLVLTPGFFWCALHFWWASRTVYADIARAHSGSDSDDSDESLEILQTQH